MALTHQHIVHRINGMKSREAEAAFVDDLAHMAKPLFYLVFGIAAVVCIWITTSDYRDVAKHHIDTKDMRRSNAAMSTLIVRCANGEAVAFDGGIMRCTHYPLVPL